MNINSKTLSYVAITMTLLLSGCGGGGDNQASGIQGAQQSGLVIEREFLFDGNENISVSPVILSGASNGLGGCEARGVVTNVSVDTCQNLFVKFNVLDQSGVIIAQPVDLVRNIPSNTGAQFQVDIVSTSAGFVQCNDIGDLVLELEDRC